jgi:hypothetical protein
MVSLSNHVALSGQMRKGLPLVRVDSQMKTCGTGPVENCGAWAD